MDDETLAALERTVHRAGKWASAHYGPEDIEAAKTWAADAALIRAIIERERAGGERAKRLVGEAARMKALERNWDGYGADRIAPEVVDELVRVLTDGLADVQFVPGGDGSVQAEWHTPIASIELCVTPADAIASDAHLASEGE